MRTAISRISAAVDFTTLLSRNQLFNLFHGVKNCQVRSLSQFNQRESFNSNNKRSIEDIIHEEKLYQSEYAIFDHNKDNINKQVYGIKGQTINRTFESDQIESKFDQIHDAATARAKYSHVFYKTLPNR
jgi:hypothetical protein